MIAGFKKPIYFLPADPEPAYPDLPLALIRDPANGSVLPAIFTGRELAERWQERFINAGKPVGLERWENLGGVRTMLVACLNAGFEYALIDPPPGSTEFRRRWHLETVVDLLNA